MSFLHKPIDVVTLLFEDNWVCYDEQLIAISSTSISRWETSWCDIMMDQSWQVTNRCHHDGCRCPSVILVPGHQQPPCWLNCGYTNTWFILCNIYIYHITAINSLWYSEVIWRQGSRSTLAQVMACCLMAPSHYLNQCWLMISEVLWHSPDSNFTENTSDIYRWNEFEID